MKEFLNKFFIGLLVIIVILLSLWGLSKVPFNVGAILYIITVVATIITCVIFWYWYLIRGIHQGPKAPETKEGVEDGSEDEM